MLVMEEATGEAKGGGKEWRSETSHVWIGFGKRARYVIARRTNGALELLHTAMPSGGEALPVFSAEPAAWRYLRSVMLGTEWHVRESRDGELVSMLMCLCSGVRGVLLDPDPAVSSEGGAGVPLDRESFLDACLSIRANYGQDAGLPTEGGVLVRGV